MVMVFSCDKNDNAVFEGAKVQGSAFPTHSFDISIQEGGSASATLNNKVIEQGLLEDLWKCSNFAEVKERIGGGECIKNCPKP